MIEGEGGYRTNDSVSARIITKAVAQPGTVSLLYENSH